MSPHTLFVEQNTGIVSGSVSAVTTPNIKALLGARLTLKVAFHTAGVIAAITSYTADTMRLAVKKADDLDSPTSLLPLGTWSVTGSGTSTRYELVVELDSDQLQAAIGDLPEIVLRGQLQWEISTQDEPRLSYPFDITVINSPARTDDGAPDPAGAETEAWLLAQLATAAALAIPHSFGRVTADTNAFSGAWTTLFTIPVVAAATYKLDLSLIASFTADANMRVVGDLITGATAHGFWLPVIDSGDYAAVEPYAFNAGSADELITNSVSGSGIIAALPQSFILITTSTAGNIIIKARSSAPANGVIKAGSHYLLTRLA